MQLFLQLFSSSQAMSADRAADSLAALQALGDPFQALRNRAEAKKDKEAEKEQEAEELVASEDPYQEEELHDGDYGGLDDEDEVVEPKFGEPMASEADLGRWGWALETIGIRTTGWVYEEAHDEEEADEQADHEEEQQTDTKAQPRTWTQAEIDEWYNQPMMLAAESLVANMKGVAWKDRGPRFGPEEGGPTTWRGQSWRPTTKKWAKRGGRNLKYWSQVYSKQGKGGSSSSSSMASSSWEPNPMGKGKAKDDPEGNNYMRGKGTDKGQAKKGIGK